jgi:hypothetical protein
MYLISPVTYYNHAKTMAFAAILTRHRMDINAYVHLISAASIVKSIIVFVIQIHVGMMVWIHIPFYYRIIHILILFHLGNCSVFNTTFNCTCVSGWQGSPCQTQINHCENVTYMNYGVCRPLFRDYKCKCFNGSFYGIYCEITAMKIIIFRIVSKSFAFIAIIAMVSVVTFIIVMDVLKYFLVLMQYVKDEYKFDKYSKKNKMNLMISDPTSMSFYLHKSGTICLDETLFD